MVRIEYPVRTATLFKRSGKKVFAVAWHHDGAAKGPKPIGFGNC
jgi:hypothetical protein